MSPEREIVNIWLNRRGFFTVSGINAGSRVIDFIAVSHKAEPRIMHIEVTCSISSNFILERDVIEINRLFKDSNVNSAVQRYIRDWFGKPYNYENVLVTNFQNLKLDGIRIIKFEDVLFDVINDMDKQRYRSQAIRTMQLIKFLLMGNPVRMSELFGRQSLYKPMSAQAKEELIKELLSQESGKRVFRKQSNEQLLVEILRSSSLNNPERLANALEEILTKRTGSRFLRMLMEKKGVQSAIREEISKDKKLESFFKV
ncbi:hypothetical protein HYY72_01400 [Candidatus Woesearchaeota archaeon]|nr:hypothetical protein [Candidatus Woesearchaeota archaeon]